MLKVTAVLSGCMKLRRFDTQAAIQTVALRASVIPAAADETEASCATAKSVSNDVTDAG